MTSARSEGTDYLSYGALGARGGKRARGSEAGLDIDEGGYRRRNCGVARVMPLCEGVSGLAA